MKKLLNTLFVLSENVYLALEGENIVILGEDESKSRFPLHTLENIVCFSYKGASPALMGACAERSIGFVLMSPRGKFLARITGKSHGNVLLRKAQYRISDNEESSALYAKNMITGKIFNSRWMLERTVRDHAARVDAEKIKSSSGRLQDILKKLQDAELNLDSIRGTEGDAASEYFSVFDELIINQKDDFVFTDRNRRPPTDNLNALLSFAYTILANECGNALESVGLDSYVGFLHRDRPGRSSLALDIMEELRVPMADRFVITLVNKKAIKAEHFEQHGDGAVWLNDKGRRQFLSAWQKRKKEIITHPFLKEKMEWGLVPYVQSLLLARTIRGDLEEYPPFMWK